MCCIGEQMRSLEGRNYNKKWTKSVLQLLNRKNEQKQQQHKILLQHFDYLRFIGDCDENNFDAQHFHSKYNVFAKNSIFQIHIAFSEWIRNFSFEINSRRFHWFSRFSFCFFHLWYGGCKFNLHENILWWMKVLNQ